MTVFVVGVWTLVEKTFVEHLSGSNLYVASAGILIVTGVLIAFISVIGTYSAYRECRSLLISYFVILLLIFVLMLVASVLGFVFRSEVRFCLHCLNSTRSRSHP